MSTPRKLAARHLTLAIITVILVNAQLAWWVLYAMRESTVRVDLERRALGEAAATASMATDLEMTLAAAELTATLDAAAGEVPPAAALPTSFATARIDVGPCDRGYHRRGQQLQLDLPMADGRCLIAVAKPDWASSLDSVADGLELADAADPDRPATGRPAPLEGVIQPTAEAWAQIDDNHRSRTVMMLAEGTFFAAMLLLLLTLLWRNLRRETQLERQHQNFLSAITHELKSPLAAIRLSLETVLRGRADVSSSMRFMENALQDTERMQGLIQKVLEVTRYAAGRGTLSPHRSEVSTLVEDAVDSFSRRAIAAGARMNVDIDPGVMAPVDEEALPIAVTNLLENAIKYGGTLPKIGVRVAVEGTDAIIEITDNGHGIPVTEHDSVFERFYRCGDEMTRTTEGTGLGLFLVRQIMLAHKGNAVIASSTPEGTVFRLSIPSAVSDSGSDM